MSTPKSIYVEAPAGLKGEDRACSPLRATDGPRRLSEELAFLIAEFAERPVRLREVMGILRGRAWTILLIVLALPFCTPIPMPGISAPFGLVIAAIGLRLALGQKTWLPARLLDTQVPTRFFSKALGATRRLIRFLEFFLRPRSAWLLDVKVLQHACGAVILLSGVLLLLPLPIPFTNGLPALTVVLIAGAMLERDGYSMIAGMAVSVLTLCFFSAIAFGGAEMVHWLKDWVGGMFPAD